jgi:hypothetical protein
MLVVAGLAAHSYPGSGYEPRPQGWDAAREIRIIGRSRHTDSVGRTARPQLR